MASINWQHGDSKLFKLDRTGVILWEHTLTYDTESLSASKLEELNNGDILIGGRTHKYEESWGDAFLMKFDACGNLIWFKEYGLQDELDQLYGIIPDEDGSIFILQTIGTSEGRFTLRKLNSEGEILSTQQHFQEIGFAPVR